ncbi:MAG TPA: helix-turn-helix transcriptional regulator [Actinophytocola sp.]|jgi:transcriptional regulator with XRE-family HTH domain|uniref:helix-turn-helix domain-containing protein n=1 Tax=Actinophytocola sp. TaxID=1872138 RepID=UPI002DFA6F66|nr:helix-turn-helix transcriptional regulator [Actinophytocola sp.]
MLTSGGYSVRVRIIGEELRAHREAAGLTLREAEQKADIDKTKLCRMENGERPQKIEDVACLLAVYGVIGEQRRHLLNLTREADRPGLLQRNSSTFAQKITTLRFLESRATRLINFECQVIPGLLQTFPYAEALIRHGGMFDNEVAAARAIARIHRQGVLRKSRAPQYQAIIMEGALHNLVGDDTVMRDQLVYLTEAAKRPNVSLRIIPASAGNHPGVDGPFLRLDFDHRSGVVVLCNRTSSVYLENEEDLMDCANVVVELLSVALGEEESVALVTRIAATWGGS